MPRSSPALLLASLLAFASPLAAQNLDSVQITRQRVADGVYMLLGAGGNIGVSAGADGVFVIDDQYAPLSQKIKAAVRTFSTVRVRLARAKIQGLTAEQVMNANLLADLDSTWGKGFLTPAQFVAIAYGSLGKP